MCEPEYTINGISGYKYESAKDNIEWSGYKVKLYMRTIMDIGKLQYMAQKDYDSLGVDESKSMDLEGLDRLAKILEKK